MVVDAQGTVYALTVSGLSVIPLTPSSPATRPQIAPNRGILNSSDGTSNIKPGSFITVNGAKRGGKVRTSVVETRRKKEVQPIIREHIRSP